MTLTPLQINGDCTIENIGQLHRKLNAHFSAKEGVAIDLSAMESIDAAGIQLLISFKNSAAAKGIKLHLSGIPDFLGQSLQGLGLDPNFLARG